MSKFTVALLIALLFLPSLTFAQPQVQGQWQTHPNLMTINPIHVALLRTGKVLVIAGSGNVAGNLNYRAGIWDPQSGSFTTQGLTWDMFCNGMSVLPDGQVLVAGGTLEYDPFLGESRASLYDPSTGNFTDIQDMAHGRWYPTTTVLGNGSMMVFSGFNETGGTNNAVEIYTPGSGWSAEFVAPWTPPLYPRMHLLPNGKVFYAGPSINSHLFDPVTRTWTLNYARTVRGSSRTYGSTVLLPLLAADGFMAKVLTAGGGNPATATTEIIDFSAATPAWANSALMSAGRIQMNAVILPNGKVLLLGGSVNDESAASASLAADLFDPATGTMSSAGAQLFPRLYHSVALLLPDGRVWVAGGNPERGSYEQHIEIYSPAYLFTTGGLPATRPTISFAPSGIGYGGTFDVQTPDALNIGSVALVRPGSSTHAFDMDQRMVGLSFTASGGLLTVNEPPSGNTAPPGYYMLFLVNNAGVPSIANFVQVNTADFSISASPASRTVVAGTGTSYTVNVAAIGSFNGGVTLSATGLPSGAGATFNPTSVTGSGSSTMNVTSSSSTPAGTYSLVITGTSGPLTHNTTVTLVVTPTGGGGTPAGGALYPFNENTGSTTADVSGNNNTGTLATGTTWTAGKYGNGLQFDGTNGRVTVADTPSLDLGNTGTIAAWVKLNSLNRWHGVIAKGAVNNDSVHNYALEINNANRFMCILGNGSSSVTVVSSTTATTGTFYHLACVWNGTTLQLYVNGAANASATQTLVPAANTSALYLGQFGGNADRLDGIVDEVRIYNTALSQAQIVDAMNTPVQPPVPDTQDPVVNITAPAAGALLSGTVTVSANASDNVGVTGVQFIIDGANFGAEDVTAPYSISWNTAAVANGSHSISAVARDAAGNRGNASLVPVTTNNDLTAPTAPANLAPTVVSSTQINLVWNASSDNVGVSGYRITRNGTAIDTTAATSYQNTGLSAGTTYTYTVAAYDAAGNFSTESNSATATTPGLPPPAPPVPVASYAFRENAGTTTVDGSGNGNQGTLTKGPVWTTGKFGSGISFDGVNDHVLVPDRNSLDLGATGTVSAWVRLNQLNRWNSVIAKGSANNDALHNYALEINNANRFMCILGNGSASRTLTSTTTATTGTFYHLACVWDGTTLQLYINGALNTSTAQNLTPAGNAASLYIGLFGGNADPLAGVIDEVRIYNRALTQAQVQNDMNSPL
ncbi:MAG: DUF1929 domain-containing protein [Acidobacteriales bacterium]|nr:DUF1929 domain-containing protein [Terriglobales bacterium]